MRTLKALLAAPAALIVVGGLAGSAAAAAHGDRNLGRAHTQAPRTQAAHSTAAPAATNAQDQSKTGKQHMQEAKNANDCRPLEDKFDAAYASRKNQPGAEEAKRMRDLGAERCTDGDYDQGINNLYSALDQLGVKH